MTEDVLIADLNVPYESRFTKAGQVNQLDSYPVPPVTTIRGVLYGALGRPSMLGRQKSAQRDEIHDIEMEFRDRVESETEVGIRVVESPTVKDDLRSRHKTGRNSDDTAYIRYVAEETTLIEPTYRVYIRQHDGDDLLRAFEEALNDPERLLFLGRSDDMVIVDEAKITPMERRTGSKRFSRVVVPEGDGEPILLPTARDRSNSRSPRPAGVSLVSLGGEVTEWYEADDPPQRTDNNPDGFVFID